MGAKVEQVKKMAPTRPHPSAPDEPPGDKLLGPVTGLFDRLRDAVSIAARIEPATPPPYRRTAGAFMTDQYTIHDPSKQYPQPQFDEQQQAGPRPRAAHGPKPDHGESTYRGTGRLTGRRAVITGGDSGIGRAGPIAFAREGADLVLSYLPEEQADAEEVVKFVEETGRTCVTVPGDISDGGYCEQLVDEDQRLRDVLAL
jgi:hypothetical protein